MAAFEAITTRHSWYAAATIAKYAAVMIDTDGKYAAADGTRPFVGIVEYGGAADEMITVVKGSYPAVASENVTAGALLTIDGSNAGKFRIADTAEDVVYGVALTAADAGDLFTIQMSDVSVVIPTT